MMKDQSLDNLWLARAMYEMGAVTFGDFTLGGSTSNSPVYINPRVLISNPTALRVAAKLMYQEVTLAQSLRRSKAQTYDVVAGVPVGGLLLAVAFSLESSTPLIYSRPKPEGTGQRGIEGRYSSGSRALLVDDLIAGGASINETARFLAEHDVVVHDAVVLVDREMGAKERLKQNGINLISIIKLDVMMNLYRSSGYIDEEQYDEYLAYVRANRAATEQDSSITPTFTDEDADDDADKDDTLTSDEEC
ncbi:MAG: phosphoribosyltransferase family protein [Ktedonobacterales bacterium]